MKRSYKSGFQKRKKKQQIQQQIQNIPKLDKFLTSSEQDIPPQSQDSSLTDESTIRSSSSTMGQDLCEPAPCDLEEEISLHQFFPSGNTGVAHEESSSDENEENIALAPFDATETVTSRSNDIGLWTSLSEEDKLYWIEKGPTECQNWNDDFKKSQCLYKNQYRYCHKSFFKGTKANGEVYDREWLVYSPSVGSVFCFVCKLFSSSTGALSSTGFSDWKHAFLIQSHENSLEHRNCLLTYLTRKRNNNLDSKLCEQISAEREYWRQVIQRCVEVIKTLAERGLAFRGDNEVIGSPNNGNYLGLLELIAKFDPFLHNHIEHYGNRGSGHTSYLSKTICDELIELMGNLVQQSILEEVKQAGYFSLSVDSTPDVSHVDQLTIILRYVSQKTGLPVERFITFLKLEDHTAKHMAKLVYDFLVHQCGIDFTKCRGQSYDNAANMSGKYNGMQHHILEINKYARYIPCAGHSLNLIGQAAVDCCLEAVNFFAIIQEIYNFFSASTKRWAILTECLPTGATVPKSLSDTRWEAHNSAVSAAKANYDYIQEALHKIESNAEEKGDTRLQAKNILNKMDELEFLIMLELWNTILGEFHKTSKALQDPEISLETCANLYSSLYKFVDCIKEQFERFESDAKATDPDLDYRSVTKRIRKRKRHFDEDSVPVVAAISPRDSFKVQSFDPIIDALKSNLDKRAKAYTHIAKTFSFLVNVNISEDGLSQGVDNLIKAYPEDVNDSFLIEVKHFHIYVKQKFPDKNTFLHQDLYQIIFNDKIHLAFPNVESVLRLFLCMMVTNCSGERSFSQLKRIKGQLRSTLTQNKLGALSILCIESDKLCEISFDDLIKDCCPGAS